MWAQKDDREFWLQWLEHYRSLKCLWESETKRRVSRNDRLAAYQELADMAKVINPNADVRFVRSRINAFRTCYRREFKKVEAAKHNGITYTPQLFYYETLKFVNPDEFLDDSFFDSKYDFDSDEDGDPISQESSEPKNDNAKRVCVKREAPAISFSETSNPSFSDTNKAQINQTSVPVRNTNIAKRAVYSGQSVAQQQITSEDENDLIGKRIAAHFRSMQLDQRLMAEKIISDVCIYARMEKLSMRSCLLLEGMADGQDSIEPEDFGVQEVMDENVDYDNPDTYIYTS